MPEYSQISDPRSLLIKYAARILTARPYFKSQLKEKLYLRAEKLNLIDVDKVIESILTDLENSGYLNDQYLVSSYIRNQLSKGYGPQIISFKLHRLGASKPLIESCIKTEITDEAQVVAIQKYSRKFSRLEPRRLISRLYTRGFSGRLIRNVFDGDYNED